MGARFIKVAVIYFIIGVGLGMYMGIGNMFVFTSAHAHINLLGWVSLALAGVIYQVFPDAGESKLATVHFWLHMVGLPIFITSMFMFGLGNHEIAVPTSAVGGILVAVGVVVFAINCIVNIKSNKR